MTPEQAISILSNATEPQAIGRLSRQDYVNVNNALLFLQQVAKCGAELEKENAGLKERVGTLEKKEPKK